jgi:hypothetical protein
MAEIDRSLVGQWGPVSTMWMSGTFTATLPSRT